jgi:hypothetical protein
MYIDQPNDEIYDRCAAVAGSPKAGFLRFIGEETMPKHLDHITSFEPAAAVSWLANEYVVFKTLIDTALENGLSISIPGDLRITDSRDEIMGWFRATDDMSMHFHRPETLSELGSTYLVFGNDGYDLIADHTSGDEMLSFIADVEKKIADYAPDIDPNPVEIPTMVSGQKNTGREQSQSPSMGEM